jgi:hypothetical protein
MARLPAGLAEHVKSIKGNLPSRPSASEYAPHIAMLKELGYTDKEINAAFGWETSMRFLREVKRAGRLDGTGRVKIEPNAVPKEKLDEEYAAMLEWTPEAFISFYNRFCDKPMPDHCREWVSEAFNSELLLLNVPPRHNKSTLFSVWWTVWNLVRDRDFQMLIVSLTDTLSARWVGYIASILANSDVPLVFGRFKPEKMDGELPWQPSRGQLMILGRSRSGGSAMQFSVLSRGAGSQILGFEADGIVADDVTSKRIAVSPIEREKQIEWFQEEVMSRLQPDGRAIVVGQRVHMNDLYGHLRQMTWDYGKEKGDAAWGDISYPAVITWPDEESGIEAEVLWPEVWSFEKLMKRKVIVGGTGPFMTMYQQDPQAADAVLVREEWLEQCRDYDRKVGFGAPVAKDGEAFLPVARVASLDPSPTMYNGLIVADVVSSRDQFFCIIVDIKSFKADWHSIREEITKTIDKYHPTYFIFEKNIAQYWAKGDPFIEELRAKVRILEHTTSAINKFEQETGLESLSYDFETNAIRLPYGSPESRATSEILEKEARNWTREGRLRDDVLMALWFIKSNWRKLTPLNQMPRTFRGAKQTEVSYRSRLRGNDDVVAAFRKRRDAQRRLQSA